MSELTIIGGGLAGCEAAWQAASKGIKVTLCEMRPVVNTPVHQTHFLSELVCSNSLGASEKIRPTGLLENELQHLGSFVLQCAHETALPAGGALAVDRTRFAQLVTQRLESTPNIILSRHEVTQIPVGPTIISTGPLTSPAMAASISNLSGSEFLFFYDALAPIVTFESINLDKAFWGSRYSNENEQAGDYLNCPFSEEEYYRFIGELTSAQRIPLKSFEEQIEMGVKANILPYFESCLPIEVLASRHPEALGYGPLRPVGIDSPHSGAKPYAVLQLRQENVAKTLFNLVGFQTNLTYSEQERVFRLIPGLEEAEFIRYGQMHRNTYINAPELLFATTQYKQREDLFFAGQVAGIEGYAGNIASGYLAGTNASRFISGQPLLVFPQETMIGALHHYISHAEAQSFQPIKANFGLLPEPEQKIQKKRDKKANLANRALRTLAAFMLEYNIGTVP